jgi:hypothetical protein
MRHLWSVVLAVVFAPIALLLAGRGLVALAGRVEAVPTDYFGIAAASSALLLAGLILAMLTMAKLSPVGPTFAGLAYLGLGIWALADPTGFQTRVQWDLIWLTADQVTASAEVAPLLAVPLLVTLFIPRRWRGRERPEPVREPRFRPAETLDLPRVPVPPPPAVPAHPPSPPPQPPPRPPTPPPWPAPPPPGPVPPPPPPPVPMPPPPGPVPPPPPPAAPAPAVPVAAAAAPAVPAVPAAPPGEETTDVLPSSEPTITLPSDETTTSLNPAKAETS